MRGRGNFPPSSEEGSLEVSVQIDGRGTSSSDESMARGGGELITRCKSANEEEVSLNSLEDRMTDGQGNDYYDCSLDWIGISKGTN